MRHTERPLLKPRAAARLGAAEKGDSGVFYDYDRTQHAHARKKAKCSGQAERSGKFTFVISLLDCDSPTRPCAKEAKRSDHAERSEKRAPLDYEHSEKARAPHTNGPRDVPRCEL
jgi:hypothetical protein